MFVSLLNFPNKFPPLYPHFTNHLLHFLFTLMCALVFPSISMYDCINYLHTIIPFTYDGISTKNMGVFFSFPITAPHRTSYKHFFLHIKKRKAFPFSSMIFPLCPLFIIFFKCDINTEFSYFIFFYIFMLLMFRSYHCHIHFNHFSYHSHINIHHPSPQLVPFVLAHRSLRKFMKCIHLKSIDTQNTIITNPPRTIHTLIQRY